MDTNILCSAVSPILDFYQGFLDVAFGFFSFIGVTAPSIRSTIGALFGCAA